MSVCSMSSGDLSLNLCVRRSTARGGCNVISKNLSSALNVTQNYLYKYNDVTFRHESLQRAIAAIIYIIIV